MASHGNAGSNAGSNCLEGPALKKDPEVKSVSVSAPAGKADAPEQIESD